MKTPRPSRGEIWVADLGETRGHEQAGRRPVLVVSVDTFNLGPSDLAIVVPITTRERRMAYHVRLDPDDSGLRKVSFAKCEDIRSVSRERLLVRVGALSAETMVEVEDGLRMLLDL